MKMKKLFLFALATAMMIFAGCQNKELEAPVNSNEGSSTFELIADIALTKTTLDAQTYEVEWEEGDVVYMVTSGAETPWATSIGFTYADGKFSTDETIANGSYTFNGLYAVEGQARFHKGESSTHKLEAIQSQDCTNPTAHIKWNDALVGTFDATIPMAEAAQMNMSHLYTLMQVDVKNNTGAAIEVTKFEMTAADADLAGIFNIDSFDTPAISKYSGTSSTITVNLTNATVEDNASLPVYFVMAPLANHTKDITFKVTDSEDKTYTKTINIKEGISFTAGTYNTTPYTITTADVVEPQSDVYGLIEIDGAFEDGGKYVLAFKDGKDGTYAFINSNGTSGTVVKNALDVTGGTIVNPSSNYVFTAIASGDGFNFKNSSGNYIYNSGSGTSLNTNNNTATIWVPTFLTASSTYKLVASRYIAFNGSDKAMGYAIINFTDQVAQGIALAQYAGAISVFKLNYIPVVTPKILIAETSYTALADSESVEIPYSTENVSGKISAVVTSDVEGMVSGAPVVESDKVIVYLNANETDADKSATITLSYEGAEDIEVTISQYAAASIDEGLSSIYKTVSSADSNSPDEFAISITDAIVTYVSGNTAFLEDETAGMLIYKSSHGLVAGDKLTGVLTGKAYVRYGVHQISDYDFNGSKESGVTVPVSVITISDLLADYGTYVSRRVKIENATVTDAVSGTSDKNGTVSQGENAVNLYNNSSDVSFVVNDVVDFVAYPSYYNELKQLATYASPVSKKVATPTISCTNNVVTIACATAGATIYYAIDDADYTVYAEAFEIEEDCTVKAYATKTGLIDSPVSTKDLVVTSADEPAPKAWTLVTDASTLAAGDQIIIVAKDYNYAISTEQKSNNRGQAAVTKSGSTISEPGTQVQKLTLEIGKTTGTFAFNTGSGYLYAASSSSNYLKTEKTMSDNSSWNITIASGGTATVKATGANTRNIMQYNQSSSLFACYSSASQKAISIYRYE